MTVNLLQGNSLKVLAGLPSGSVQTCVTSPPYYGLRDYGTAEWEGGNPECSHNPQRPDGGDRNDRTLPLGRGGLYRDICGKCGAIRMDDQIGLEETPEQYIDKLVSVFREVRRVLKDDGTLWLNLGDSYARLPSRGKKFDGGSFVGSDKNGARADIRPAIPEGWKEKDMLMIPARVALALQADGWYLRSEIIWHKPNPMPESVRDRPTKAHEMIYLLAKQPRYFYDAEAVREPAAYDGRKDTTVKPSDKYAGQNMVQGQQPQTLGRGLEQERWPSKLTDGTPARNRRSVWTVTTKPYKEAHFATFPPDLIEPCILAGTSERGECPSCGRAWVRVVGDTSIKEHDGETDTAYKTGSAANRLALLRQAARERGEEYTSHKKTLGWSPSCSCIDESDHNGPFEPVSQTVLDPFNGSGTTGAVSLKHGRDYIGIELNPKYITLTEKRLSKVQPLLLESA